MLHKLLYFFVILVIVTSIIKVVTLPSTTMRVPETAPANSDTSVEEKIRITTPDVNAVVQSPLRVEGQARGPWFFEGSFPVVLTNWDGLIIAEGVATAEGEWMTEELVPFIATLSFVSPYTDGDPEFMQRGSLILRKDNPSGLPEHDDAFEIPVRFAPVLKNMVE